MTEKQLADRAALEQTDSMSAMDSKDDRPAKGIRSTVRGRDTAASGDTGNLSARQLPGDDDQMRLRKRARRRLVGAIALALLAVIVLPMVMDQEPRPLTQDIQIRIPSQEQNSTSLIARITPHKTAPTPLPDDSVAAGTATAASPVVPDSAEPPSEARPDSKAAAAPLAKESAKDLTKETAAAKAAPQDAAKDKPKEPAKDAKPADAQAKSAESARAAAVLNDQPQQWVIQLGAYREQGNISVLQAKVKELGYPSYTEKVDTPQGARVRLRCGPFPNREAAEKAQARLKKIGAGGPTGGVLSQK